MQHLRQVLVVEDDDTLRDLLADCLRECDYDVLTAADGTSALARLAEARPALILLDVGLPDMDGSEFAVAYRQRAASPAPIALVTGRTAPEAAGLVERIGASGVVLKPFDLATLVEIVERFACAEEGVAAAPSSPHERPAPPANMAEPQALAPWPPIRLPQRDPVTVATTLRERGEPWPPGHLPQRDPDEWRRQAALRALAERMTALRQRQTEVAAEVGQLGDLERTRKLRPEEATRVQRLRLESQALGKQLEEAWQAFDDLDSEGKQPG